MWKFDHHHIVIRPNGEVVAFRSFEASLSACGEGSQSMLGSTYRASVEWFKRNTLEQVVEADPAIEQFAWLSAVAPATARIQ